MFTKMADFKEENKEYVQALSNAYRDIGIIISQGDLDLSHEKILHEAGSLIHDLLEAASN